MPSLSVFSISHDSCPCPRNPLIAVHKRQTGRYCDGTRGRIDKPDGKGNATGTVRGACFVQSLDAPAFSRGGGPCTDHTGDFRVTTLNPKSKMRSDSGWTIIEKPVRMDTRTDLRETDLQSLSAFESYADQTACTYVAQTPECQELDDWRLV